MVGQAQVIVQAFMVDFICIAVGLLLPFLFG
jgi:hypothetical protein